MEPVEDLPPPPVSEDELLNQDYANNQPRFGQVQTFVLLGILFAMGLGVIVAVVTLLGNASTP